MSMQPQSGDGCITLTHSQPRRLKGEDGQYKAPAALSRARYPGGKTGTKNLTPTGIRSSDRPACSELLYRLRSSGHIFWY